MRQSAPGPSQHRAKHGSTSSVWYTKRPGRRCRAAGVSVAIYGQTRALLTHRNLAQSSFTSLDDFFDRLQTASTGKPNCGKGAACHSLPFTRNQGITEELLSRFFSAFLAMDRRPEAVSDRDGSHLSQLISCLTRLDRPTCFQAAYKNTILCAGLHPTQHILSSSGS